MPAYDFMCPGCDWTGELLQVPYLKRHQQQCPECGTVMQLALRTPPKTGNRYTHQHKTKAIITQGERKVGYVEGHFGKESKRRKK